jgi:hypothetical protein
MVKETAGKAVRDEKLQEFIGVARASAAHFKRTGIAYSFEDVERYILKRAAGRKATRPKPTKIPRSRR